MLEITPGSNAFQRPVSTQNAEESRAVAQKNSAPASETTAPAQPRQQAAAPQDSSEAHTHQESDFEPGSLHFGGAGSEPSFTPLNAQSTPSRAEIQQSADDNLSQLRSKRIENRLSQLAEEQLRQIKDIRQS